MSGEPAKSCRATAAPQTTACTAARDSRARSAASQTQGIQLAPPSWIHMFPSERKGPEAIQQAAATKAPPRDDPRRWARKKRPVPAKSECATTKTRVQDPRRQQQVQPGEGIERLRVGVRQHRLPEGQERIPHRPGSGADGADEGLHLRVPDQVHVALVEGLAAEHRPGEEDEGQQREGRDGEQGAAPARRSRLRRRHGPPPCRAGQPPMTASTIPPPVIASPRSSARGR